MLLHTYAVVTIGSFHAQSEQFNSSQSVISFWQARYFSADGMVMVKGSCTILKHNFSVSTVCLFKHTSVLTAHKPAHPITMAASVVEYGCKTFERANVLTHSFTCCCHLCSFIFLWWICIFAIVITKSLDSGLGKWSSCFGCLCSFRICLSSCWCQHALWLHWKTSVLFEKN